MIVLRVTERYLDGRVSRVLTGDDAGGYESVAHLRLLARSRGWRQVFDIPSGVQHRTRGILSDSTWGEVLCDVQLIDPLAPRCTWILATTGRCTNPATNGDVCAACEDARDKRRD